MFGQLEQRFPILLNKIRMATERIPTVVTACFILHSVAKFLNDPEFEADIGDEMHEEIGVPDLGDASLHRRGALRRNQIANTIAGL